MYLSEIRELVDGLLYHVNELEVARDKWLENERVADAEAKARPHEFSVERFNEALHQAGYQQATIFGVLEGMLAAWARLSLLLYPVRGKGAEGQWRLERGRILREVLDLPAGTLLERRSFRDSWMHFDERMDRAIIEGRLHNRQQFTLSAGVPSAVTLGVRVIDVEGLVYHYRDEAGTVESVSIHDMKACLLQLKQRLTGYGDRLMKLPAPPK
jgi:hypothetical protein